MHWTRGALAHRLLQISDLDVTRRNMPKENILLMIQNVSCYDISFNDKFVLIQVLLSNSGNAG